MKVERASAGASPIEGIYVLDLDLVIPERTDGGGPTAADQPRMGTRAFPYLPAYAMMPGR
jgi:hypothetical protein